MRTKSYSSIESQSSAVSKKPRPWPRCGNCRFFVSRLLNGNRLHGDCLRHWGIDDLDRPFFPIAYAYDGCEDHAFGRTPRTTE